MVARCVAHVVDTAQGTPTFDAEQKRWSQYILDTQAVVNAVLASLRAGGEPVAL
jgi:hypothetical protein